jgi:hypothetical protein
VVYSAASNAGRNLLAKCDPPFRSSGRPLPFVARQNAAHARHSGESSAIYKVPSLWSARSWRAFLAVIVFLTFGGRLQTKSNRWDKAELKRFEITPARPSIELLRARMLPFQECDLHRE